ncbi:MAG: mechanosensitive ion channel domain-containing protein [Anaerolineales bacterium]
MDITALQLWIEQNPAIALLVVLALSVSAFLIARELLARGLTAISSRTETKVDDILVHHLRPFRVAWLAPLTILYAFAYLVPAYQSVVETASLFLIVWITAITLIAFLGALNEIYESSAGFKGESIQGYLDILKILVVVGAVILSISTLTGKPPTALLAGLGALTAVLLLIFQETILSLVASVQIGTQDLIKEGDWIEVPSYDADGDVTNITLHTVTIQNFDKTISYVPTRKIAEVAFKNWRGMEESGGRRIKRAIYLDLGSIRFCDDEMLTRFRKVDILQPYIDQKVREIDQENRQKAIVADSPLDGRRLTNLGTFRAYIEAYLHGHKDIYSEGMVFLVRQLAPGPTGVPLEVYVFTKTTAWEKYERIQADIFDHLLASVPYFDLRVFQEPTGMDFATMLRPPTS